METTGRWELPRVARCSQQGARCRGRGVRHLDPYDADVNNRKIFRYLCEPCTRDLAIQI